MKFADDLPLPGVLPARMILLRVVALALGHYLRPEKYSRDAFGGLPNPI